MPGVWRPPAWVVSVVAVYSVRLIAARPVPRTDPAPKLNMAVETSSHSHLLKRRRIFVISDDNSGSSNTGAAIGLAFGLFATFVFLALITMWVKFNRREAWSKKVVAECRERAEEVQLPQGHSLIPPTWRRRNPVITAYTLDFETFALILMQNRKGPMRPKVLEAHLKTLRVKLDEESVIVVLPSGELSAAQHDLPIQMAMQIPQTILSTQLQQPPSLSIASTVLANQRSVLEHEIQQTQNELRDLEGMADDGALERKRLVLEQQLAERRFRLERLQQQQVTVQVASADVASRQQVQLPVLPPQHGLERHINQMSSLERDLQAQERELQALEDISEQNEAVRRQRLILTQQIAEKRFRFEQLKEQYLTLQASSEPTRHQQSEQSQQTAQWAAPERVQTSLSVPDVPPPAYSPS